MGDSEATLQGETLVSLRNAAEAVVRHDGSAASDGECRSRFVLGECRNGQDSKSDGREAENGLTHEIPLGGVLRWSRLRQDSVSLFPKRAGSDDLNR